MSADGITLAGSFLLVLGALAYMAVERWLDRRRRSQNFGPQGGTAYAEVTSRDAAALGEAGQAGGPTGSPASRDAALREDAAVAWLESIPVLDHEPERRS